MSNKKIWFITGAGRGMGADFAKAALAAGHAVVATGRNSDAVSKALGQSNDLLSVTLDVTRRTDAEAAVRAAIDRFGRIDVLVNNAASFYAGYFEELTPEQFERQLSVSLIGPMNVTRAVLPVMRKQRSGHIISISSSAGLAAGFDFVSAYAASKFGLEGWMESLHAEVAPFGISTTVVNPGFFRTELLTEQSTNYAEPSIADYDERRGPLVEYWKSQNGKQSGDPAKLARALITIASQEPPPRRFIAGADAIATTEQKIAYRIERFKSHALTMKIRSRPLGPSGESSFQCSAHNGATNEETSRIDTIASNQQFMRRFVEFINTADSTMARDLVSPNAIFHVPGRPDPLTGPEGYLAIIAMMRGGFPDIQWTLEQMVVEPTMVAARFHDARVARRSIPGNTADGQDDRPKSPQHLSPV